MHIVIATDLSIEALAAANLAFAFTDKFQDGGEQAHVDLLHVIEPRRLGERIFNEDSVDKQAVRKSIQRWIDDNLNRTVPYEVVLRQGRADEMIGRYADEQNADLLILGQVGKGRFAQMFLGSTAHRVAQNPPCNLLLAHREFAGFGQVSRFMVGVDLEDSGSRALQQTAALARRFDAQLEVVHVFNPPKPPGLPGGIAGYGPTAEEVETAERETHRRMEKFMTRHHDELEGLEVQSRVLSGSPVHQLVEHAVKRSADLLAVGTGRGAGADRKMLGSVADGVVRHLSCNTLLVPRD